MTAISSVVNFMLCMHRACVYVHTTREFTHALTYPHTLSIVSGNVAYNKPSSQSIGDWGGRFLAGRAVDGNTNPNMTEGHCAHPDTDWSRNAWWMVNLGEIYNISRVIIYNRDAERKNHTMAQRIRTCICSRNVLSVSFGKLNNF